MIPALLITITALAGLSVAVLAVFRLCRAR